SRPASARGALRLLEVRSGQRVDARGLRARARALSWSRMTPTDLAQRQLDAYNAHDLERFVACYHPEVEVRDFPAGELRLRGHADLRERYGPLFERPELHAELVARMTLGAVVIDQERVRGLRDGAEVQA